MAAHDHHHAHGAARPRAVAPRASLLRLSAGRRLAGVAVAIALLWAAILSTTGF